MLNKTLEFLAFIREFEKIKRTVLRPDNTVENDAEHSYQVAVLAWFLTEQFNLPLSREKLFKYALAHDLVEVYAGDTPVYAENHANTAENKEERERAALKTIKEKFGHFTDLTDAIEAYEARVDEESIFVYELDKLLPPLNMYLDDGYGWNKFNLTLERIKNEKRSKVKNSKDIVQLMEEMFARFDSEQDKLFTAK